MGAREGGLVCREMRDLPYARHISRQANGAPVRPAHEHQGGGLACLDGVEESFPGGPKAHLGVEGEGWCAWM